MTIPTQPEVVWHFGCTNRQQLGHYATPAAPQRHHHYETKLWIESLDGRLHDERSDKWLTHWIEAADGTQMTFIARRDRRIDSRPGSWCGFLMPGNSPLVTALRVAREAFPQVFGGAFDETH